MSQLYRFLNPIGLLAVLIVNGLANALPINGYTTGQLSERYPNLFVPAGITFSIWAVIYLALIGFVIYQAMKGQASHRAREAIGPWFVISCLLNIAWILAWHHLLIHLSVGIMLGLLISLINTYRRLEIHYPLEGWQKRWLLQFPFSIYLGWISVATIANISAWLVYLNWNGAGIAPNFWAAAMIFVASFVGLFLLYRSGDWPAALVLLWAFAGIALKRSQDTYPYPAILTACAFGALILLNRMLRQQYAQRSSS